MKSFRKSIVIGIPLLGLGVIGIQANLSPWLQTIESSSRFEAVFFKSVALPTGSVAVRRPPVETRAELGKLIQAAPAEADLYSLRAMEAEQQLDFPAAEADWKRYVEASSDKSKANLALADYYHRRLQPREELAALTATATPAAFARSIELIDAQALDPALVGEQYKAWAKADPQFMYGKALDTLNARKQFAAAEELVKTFRDKFPDEKDSHARFQADIEFARGNGRRAAEIWEQSFDPLWPGQTIAKYFEVVGAGKDRQLLGRLQKESEQKPDDLIIAARIYHLQQRLSNGTGAQRALLDLRSRKKTWTATDWRIAGKLFENASLVDEAARSYHALYLLNNEAGLVELTRLLLDMPDRGVQIGAGDLGLYRDIATMDQGPGYLNGVLSLVLNSQGVTWEYDKQNQAAASYFHRAKASELLDMLDKKFPGANARPELSAKLIHAYSTYGDRQGVIRSGRRFLQSFPQSGFRLQVTFLLADAYAATNQVKDELAAYDNLLQELAANAKGIPVGPTTTVRSADYVRALDRYVARLVALKQLPQALAVFRKELDRNPNDPGLYERFAAFLDQNKLGAEVEQVYKQAFQKFQDDSWSSKLARWYLRRKQAAQFEALTREVSRTFSGSSLEQYFRDVVSSSGMGPAMTLQLNLYANQRFPHNLSFVRNLLALYEARGTADPAAFERLLRQHWFEADDLRARFFQLLSRTNRLQAELDGIRAMNAAAGENPVANQLLAEGEIWRTRYEAAAAPMQAMAVAFPADPAMDSRAAMLQRSLGHIDQATGIETNLGKAAPRDTAVLTRLGEIQADREKYNAAKSYWDKIPAIEPGKHEGVIEAATLYWDYFQFDDAMRTIEAGRKRMNDASLAAYESGAIRENQRDYTKAVDEYLRGALAEDGGRSKVRLLRLARRPNLREAIERAIASRAASVDDLKAVDLRIALYESQTRRNELEAYLTNVVSRTTLPEVLARAENAASLSGMPAVERRAMERRIELAPDAIGQMRARLQFMRFLESRNDTAAAGRIIDEAYKQNPASLGVIRTAVNYYWRNKDPKRSVAVLLEAADRAKGEYPQAFRFEAARKATESGDFATAKRLLDGLRQADPAREDYLAAGAEIFARQNDDAGLKAYYEAAMTSVRGRNLSVDGLRRNLIPVLARQKDFNGATDQYIELLKRFHEDEALAREAARFAGSNGMQAKLAGFFAKAVNDSPKDFRWPLILSRLQSEFNDIDGALASLGKATAIRPDRTDLMIARARLEERTLRFEEALKSYQKIWDLSYRDPAWMDKAAEQQLRLGRPEQAVALLRQAYIDGQPEKAENYTTVARRLLEWNLIPAAREFAAKATIDVQATIAMRARQPMLAGYPIQAIGTVIEQYYTPKEKAAAAATMRGERGLAIARAAGLKDVEAAQLAAVSNGNNYYALVQLQKERLRFDELGPQLEAIAKVPARAGENADTMLREAARAYQSSGNGAAEMRVLSTLEARNSLDGELLSRYAILLVRQQAQAVAMAGNPLTSDSVRDALAKASIFAPKFTDTAAILAARGKGRPPVWTSAYTALAGVYLGAAKEPQVKQAFETVLGTQSIGDQLLARKANRNAQLTGKDWYYYAARYGQNIAGADDFAAADLESSPATASLYVQLGDVYSDRGDFTRAQSEYEYALQLNPKLPEAVRKIALTLYARGQKDQAIAAWRTALGSEYVELPGVIEDIVAAKSLDALKPDIDQAIRARFRRNGAYEAEALLRPLSQDFNWVLELANAAPGSLEVYSTLYEATWLTGAQRETVLAAVVAAADRSVQSSLGEARDMALQAAARWHAEQVRDWVNRRELAKASAALQGMSAELISRQSLAFEELSIRMAASEGKFDGLNADSLSLETLERVASGLEPKNAAAVLEFAYGRELANHRYSAAVFLGMAKIRLQQGNAAEALTLLRHMNYTIGEPFSVTDLAGDLLLSLGKAAEAREFIDALAKAKPWDPKARVLQARVAGSAQGLKELAESGDIPYAIRCEAALAIRQIKGPALQSVVDELNLLSGQATVTEQQASASPYTFELRKLAASQTSDQNVKYRLQAGALAMRPSDLKTRRELFRAAIASRRFQAATNILNDGQAEGNDLALLTDAYLRIGRNHEAEAAARTMLDTGSPGARRLLELARNAAQLQSLNEQRMPIFQENYDQDRIVMPKLIALPKRAVQGGSAQ